MPVSAPERRRDHVLPGGLVLALVLLAGCLYALHRYDQQTLRAALAGQRTHDRGAEAAALATVQAQFGAARDRDRLAAATRQAGALATARAVIPTQIARTALAFAHATGTAVAIATATAVARGEDAVTATPQAQPGFAAICAATNYDPGAVRCRVSDPRIAVSDARDGRLVIDARATPAPHGLTVDVAQTQPDGSLAIVNATSATLNGAGRASWRLATLLPTNLFGSVHIGQYQITVLINGHALPVFYLTVYH